MNRGVAGALFLLGSLIGGPVLFLAASFATVNVLRGLVLFIPAIFDLGDFRFLPNALAAAVSLAVIYGIVQGLFWLGLRTVGSKGRDLADIAKPGGALALTEVTPEYERSRRWLLVLFTLLVVSVVFAVVIGFWFSGTTDEELLRLISNGLGEEFVVVALALGIYMPFAVATFSMARVAQELEPVSATLRGPFVTVAWLLPPVLVIVWLILQWVNGSLF